MSSTLQERIGAATRDAMRARDRLRVAALRMLNSELKQIEVDERRALGDADVVGVVRRMIRQRRESERQFRDAGRTDLAEREALELRVLDEFLPAQLTTEQVDAHIDAALRELQDAGPAQMGALMAHLKRELAGQADMADVARRVKARLTA